MSDLLVHHRFTIDDYYAMARSGILTEDDRVELIEGEVLEMTPIDSRHAGCLKCLLRILSDATRGRALVGVQDPVRLDERSEPQPDLVLLEPRDDDYKKSHPGPSDVLLLVEVSGSSLEYDRKVKLPLYARAGIGEVWIVDLEGETIEVCTDPAGGRYRSSHRAAGDEAIAPQALPGARVVVSDVVRVG